jgi:hypothetical protein
MARALEEALGGSIVIPQDVPERTATCFIQFYGSFNRPEELLHRYRDLMIGVAALKFLAGFCYTQLTDIEQEINGLLTYDRQPKVDADSIAQIHRELF